MYRQCLKRCRFARNMAVIACQFPAIVKLMAEGGEYFGAVVFAVCPACGRIAARRRLKRFESVFTISCCSQIAETRAAGIAETVYFRTEAPLGLRREIVRQSTVESVIVARCVRQVIAAVVADQNSAAAQGIVCIQRLIGIKDEAVVVPRTDTGFYADGRLGSRFLRSKATVPPGSPIPPLDKPLAPRTTTTCSYNVLSRLLVPRRMALPS